MKRGIHIHTFWSLSAAENLMMLAIFLLRYKKIVIFQHIFSFFVIFFKIRAK